MEFPLTKFVDDVLKNINKLVKEDTKETYIIIDDNRCIISKSGNIYFVIESVIGVPTIKEFIEYFYVENFNGKVKYHEGHVLNCVDDIIQEITSTYSINKVESVEYFSKKSCLYCSPINQVQCKKEVILNGIYCQEHTDLFNFNSRNFPLSKPNLTVKDGKCKYQFTRGNKKGLECGKDTLTVENDYCNTHNRIHKESSSSKITLPKGESEAICFSCGTYSNKRFDIYKGRTLCPHCLDKVKKNEIKCYKCFKADPSIENGICLNCRNECKCSQCNNTVYAPVNHDGKVYCANCYKKIQEDNRNKLNKCNACGVDTCYEDKKTPNLQLCYSCSLSHQKLKDAKQCFKCGNSSSHTQLYFGKSYCESCYYITKNEIDNIPKAVEALCYKCEKTFPESNTITLDNLRYCTDCYIIKYGEKNSNICKFVATFTGRKCKNNATIEGYCSKCYEEVRGLIRNSTKDSVKDLIKKDTNTFGSKRVKCAKNCGRDSIDGVLCEPCYDSYILEVNLCATISNKNDSESSSEDNDKSCKHIMKRGPRVGKRCNETNINARGYCKRCTQYH